MDKNGPVDGVSGYPVMVRVVLQAGSCCLVGVGETFKNGGIFIGEDAG